MVQLVSQTDWVHPKSGGTSFSITLNHTATAGDLLVFVSAGGAISTPTGFTRRGTYGGGNQDVSFWEKTAAGGETSVAVTLNGSGDNVAGTIFEFGTGLTFNTSTNNGTGSTISTSSDYQVAAPSSTISANSIVIGLFSVTQSSAYSLSNRFRQFGPLGAILSTGANQDASGTMDFIYAVGVADITAANSYPANLAAGHYQATSTYLGVSPGTAFVCQVVYTDTSGVATVTAPVNNIVGENSLPGTWNGNWYLNTAGTDSTIAGYTDHPSYTPGSTVNFQVDSTSNPFRVEIYRLGWYGWDTMSARNVIGNQAYITGTTTAQSAPSVDSTLGSTSCSWTTNATWTIPSNAVSGIYYVIFRRTDVTTHAASCHFVVKPSSFSGTNVIVIPDCTHQAYNVWGATTDNGDLATGTYTGRSLYQAGSDGASANFAHRAYAVSFNRPYATQSMKSMTYIFDSEFGFIVFAECQGYNVVYASDMDFEGNNTALNSSSMVILIGHQEYWTADMYTAFQNVISNGINLFIYSSNTALWHVRFAGGDTNHRTMICYKDSGTVDTSAGFTGTGRDPVSYTGTWRDSRTSVAPNNTDVRNENQFGLFFSSSGPVQANSTISYRFKSNPFWRNSTSIQSLTSGQTYTSTVNDLGYEVDSPSGYSVQPRISVHEYLLTGLTNLANIYGSTYSGTGSTLAAWVLMHHSTSGSLIFNVGNWRGLWALSRWTGSSIGASADVNIQNAILAILYDMGLAPGSLQALEPGADTAPTNPSTGAPTSGNANVAKAYGITSPTIIQMTGFEHGSSLGLKNGAAGLTQFDTVNGTEGTNLIVQNSIARTNGYALRSVNDTSHVGNVAWNVSSGTAGNSLPLGMSILVGRFWVYVESQTNAGSDAPSIMQIGSTAGTSFLTYTESNGNLNFAVVSGSTQTATGALPLHAWAVIDFRFDCTGATWTFDWKVNGVAQTQATWANPAGTITGITFGPTSFFTITLDYDDIVLSSTATDYPLPDMHLSALTVKASGTHNTSADFNQTTNNGTTLSAISTPEALLRDLPPTVSASTDAVAQVTASSSAYLEFNHNSTLAATVYAVKHIVAGWQASASATNLAVVLHDGSMDGLTLGSPASPVSPLFQNSTTTLGWANKVYNIGPSGSLWTSSLVNLLLTRFGWATTVTGDPGVNAVYLEVAYFGTIPLPQAEPFNRVPTQRTNGR